MLENIMGRVPSGMIIVSAALSGLIPLIVYKCNKALHKNGDPPWKHK